MRNFGLDNLIDEAFSDLDNEIFGFGRGANRRGLMPTQRCRANSLLKTDISEEDKLYKLDIDIPGFKKEDIKVKLDDGYLTISAERSDKKDEEDKKSGHYIRRERYYGSVSRSWYVGDQIKQEDIHAKFNDGVLSLTIPKTEEKESLPEDKKYIAIEG